MSFASEVGSCSVAEVMGTEMFTVTLDTAVSSARLLVRRTDIHHMLVLDQGTLAGIVCRDDLRLADRDARVGDCMTSPVLCVSPETTLQEAVDIMGANNIDCLPVVNGCLLIGIVTREGLATANLSPRPAWSWDEDAWEDLESEGIAPATKARARANIACTPCGACASTQDLVSIQIAGGLPLCVRCLRIMRSNQRC
jgi:CBS domain-containing protein